MTGPLTRIPTLDDLEQDAERVGRELEALMERARDLLRKVQDAAAELDDTEDTAAEARRRKYAYELRMIGRQLMRAQAHLVPIDSDRHEAAQSMLGWLADADREDGPWAVAA